MRARTIRRPLRVAACLAFLILAVPFYAAALQQDDVRITPEEYKQRRAMLMAKMEPNSIAIFKAKDFSNRSNDVNYAYRQESNFLYLTGCEEPRAYLLLCPEGVKDRRCGSGEGGLLHPAKARSAAGESLGLEGAKAQLGFETVLPGTDLLSVAKSALAGKKTLYYAASNPEPRVGSIAGEKDDHLPRSEDRASGGLSGSRDQDSLRCTRELRSIKSPTELALLQKAIDATAVAHVEAMKSCEPGMFEYELQAVIEYCFAKNGAEYQGFPRSSAQVPIHASSIMTPIAARCRTAMSW